MKLIGQVCEAVAQVSDAEWEGVRAVYLKKHPDAFWVGLLCQLNFLHINIFLGIFFAKLYSEALYVNVHPSKVSEPWMDTFSSAPTSCRIWNMQLV